jgi:hypothetical protein
MEITALLCFICEFYTRQICPNTSTSAAFGGFAGATNQIVSIKPSVFVGGDRTGKWGVEVAYKLIGF